MRIIIDLSAPAEKAGEAVEVAVAALREAELDPYRWKTRLGDGDPGEWESADRG